MKTIPQASGSNLDAAPSSDRRSRFWWLLALIVAVVGARMAVQWNVPVPTCGFRSLTTLPCPLCGGTRALSSATQLDFDRALRFNPLVTLALGWLLTWLALGLIDLVRKRPLVPRLNHWLARRHVGWIAAVLVLANWAWLLVNPP